MSELKRYMREVSSLLECPEKEKEYYLSIIENDFGDEAEELSYEDLVERLGSPREWVDAHLEIMGGEAYESKITSLKKKRNVLTWIITAIVLLIAALTIYYIIANKNSRGYMGEYGEAVIDSIEKTSSVKGDEP